MMLTRTLLCFGVCVSASGALVAQELAQADLTALTLEDLMTIEVTSVSRAPERLSAAAAAISVITAEDIRRSGATSLPEALRLSPGLQVARVDSHTWAISSRGFNDVFANKLLVMIDGRTIYTPLFSGVFWDEKDTLIEDIDRIEVIRGPGATLWGANAVNGVINIITKTTRETQGTLISGGAGTEELGFGNVRYGFKINDQTHGRVYAKYFSRDDSKLPSKQDANDSGEMFTGGFRLDWAPNDPNLFTIQGDLSIGTFNQTYNVPTFTPPFRSVVEEDLEISGGNLLGRWTHSFSEDSEMSLQAYFDQTTRNTLIFQEDRNTIDVDFQHQLALGERQTVVWGAGYRHTSDEAGNTLSVSVFPESRSDNLFSAFLQDEFQIVPDQFSFTLGSKFEHNGYTGFEVQPGVRALWTPHQQHTVWSSISRAVRTPSRAEHDVRINPAGAPPGFASLMGNPEFQSETLVAYEIGYRVQPITRLSFDLALFYNDYDDLRTLKPLTPAPIGPTTAANQLEGETYGLELATTFQAAENWRLHSGYSYLRAHMHLKDGAVDVGTERGLERNSPRHQIFIRSALEFGPRLKTQGRAFQFDTIFRYVDTIVAGGGRIPSYSSADARLAWRARENLEIALVGQNLLDDQHPEFNPTIISMPSSEIERSVYLKMTLHF